MQGGNSSRRSNARNREFVNFREQRVESQQVEKKYLEALEIEKKIAEENAGLG